jgi:hypothetical protein
MEVKDLEKRIELLISSLKCSGESLVNRELLRKLSNEYRRLTGQYYRIRETDYL